MPTMTPTCSAEYATDAARYSGSRVRQSSTRGGKRRVNQTTSGTIATWVRLLDHSQIAGSAGWNGIPARDSSIVTVIVLPTADTIAPSTQNAISAPRLYGR